MTDGFAIATHVIRADRVFSNDSRRADATRARPQEKPATELTNGVYSALTWHEHPQIEAIVRELMDWRSSRLIVCSARRLEVPLEESHG